MVAHFVWLHFHPYAGPDVARAAVATYLKNPNCPCPKIGDAVKLAIDARSLE